MHFLVAVKNIKLKQIYRVALHFAPDTVEYKHIYLSIVLLLIRSSNHSLRYHVKNLKKMIITLKMI